MSSSSRLADFTYIYEHDKIQSPRVIFRMQRIKEDEWQIQAHHPDVEIRYIKGFKSKAEINDWLVGSRRIDWLRSTHFRICDESQVQKGL
jgi:hypothetical protein